MRPFTEPKMPMPHTNQPGLHQKELLTRERGCEVVPFKSVSRSRTFDIHLLRAIFRVPFKGDLQGLAAAQGQAANGGQRLLSPETTARLEPHGETLQARRSVDAHTSALDKRLLEGPKAHEEEGSFLFICDRCTKVWDQENKK